MGLPFRCSFYVSSLSATSILSYLLFLQQNSASVMKNFNTEAVKVAALGVTVTVSSGDDGVAGKGCNCQGESCTDEVSFSKVHVELHLKCLARML